MSFAAVSARVPENAEIVKVLIVDDSAVVRGLTRKFLEENPYIEVVATASNGQNAVNAVKKHELDVIVLDIVMPVMDGLTAIPQILAENPSVSIVISSTLTESNAAISLKALSSGAADYVAKPSSGSTIHGAADFKRELIAKVLALGSKSNRQASAEKKRIPTARRVTAPNTQSSQRIELRKPSSVPPRAIAIGCSTGGPQALQEVVAGLDATLPQPIFITQHMPATFTNLLAKHLARDTGRCISEATEGQSVESGKIYIAPGDYHMLIQGQGKDLTFHLTQTDRENYCRPSVEPMLRSLNDIFGPALLTVMLTGMGQDGLGGCQASVENGGTVIAQDEASSVVLGDAWRRCHRWRLRRCQTSG